MLVKHQNCKKNRFTTKPNFEPGERGRGAPGAVLVDCFHIHTPGPHVFTIYNLGHHHIALKLSWLEKLHISLCIMGGGFSVAWKSGFSCNFLLVCVSTEYVHAKRFRERCLVKIIQHTCLWGRWHTFGTHRGTKGKKKRIRRQYEDSEGVLSIRTLLLSIPFCYLHSAHYCYLHRTAIRKFYLVVLWNVCRHTKESRNLSAALLLQI